MRFLKRVLLHLCDTVGLFGLSSRFAQGHLHILCYHGFEVDDECSFRPKLFISEQTFARRLKCIAQEGFEVLPLDDALHRLRAGTLPKRALVITVDDGFKSTLTVAGPLLQRFDMPATVYVTTYYVDKGVPVFRLAVQYLFWRAQRERSQPVDLSGLIGADDCEVSSGSDEGMWRLIHFGEALPAESERQLLFNRVAEALDISIQALQEKHPLSLMSETEVQTLAECGFDIQLHTHRHHFPVDDRQKARREIEENRTRLRAIVGKQSDHFCYPSGVFDETQWPLLTELGVESATTCLPGLNQKSTPIYALRRFLDSEDVSFIEFKAELMGFNEILRRFRSFA